MTVHLVAEITVVIESKWANQPVWFKKGENLLPWWCRTHGFTREVSLKEHVISIHLPLQFPGKRSLIYFL